MTRLTGSRSAFNNAFHDKVHEKIRLSKKSSQNDDVRKWKQSPPHSGVGINLKVVGSLEWQLCFKEGRKELYALIK